MFGCTKNQNKTEEPGTGTELEKPQRIKLQNTFPVSLKEKPEQISSVGYLGYVITMSLRIGRVASGDHYTLSLYSNHF